MAIALEQLPDDIDALKSLVAEHVVRNEQLQSKVHLLQEQLNLALARRYAASSEKLSPDQVSLFDEAESGDAGQAEQAPDEDIVTIGLGFRSRLSQATTIGFAWETPLTDEKENLMDNRFTADLIWEF